MKGPATFRIAGISDLDDLTQMLHDDEIARERELPVADADEIYATAFQAIDDDPNNEIIIAERDGKAVGFCRLTFIPGLGRQGMWRAQLETMRVERGERGAGVGSAMLRWAADRARERGCGLIQLTTDKRRSHAHRFYQRNGFEATHEGFKMIL